MKKRTPSKKSLPKPTPRGLPTLKRLSELMKGVDLWEMGKPQDKSPHPLPTSVMSRAIESIDF